MILFRLGWRNAKDAKVYDLGHVTYLASGSLNDNGNVRSFNANRDKSNVHNNWNLQRTAISSVVVMANNIAYIFRIMFSLSDIFTAYYDCRRHKRNTYGALEFELHYESECIRLYEEIMERRYTLRPCTAFIVRDPVQREIFASHFRDRVVHHLIARRLDPYLERLLIHDVYSSRTWKGTHYGIRRIAKFIRSASENYQKDAYILKLDISWFFMGIEKELLFDKIVSIITRYWEWQKQTEQDFSLRSKWQEPWIPQDEQDILLYLIRTIIFSDAKRDLIIHGSRIDWIWLPKSKSLFYARAWCGLPIGNLTSQLFANIYMHEFDMYVKKILKIYYYGRYVDDFILIHHDREYLKACISDIRAFLMSHLALTLHPKKIYLQHYTKGVLFLGTYILPCRKYVWKRTKGNFYRCIEEINAKIRTEQDFSQSSKWQEQGQIPHTSEWQSIWQKWQKQDRFTDEENMQILARVNSYLGLMSHTDSYRLREHMMGSLYRGFWKYFSRESTHEKIILKKP